MYERFYEVIRRIPRGKVATYGQVARLAGYPRSARQVGYALAGISPELNVPWHRVINAKGEISLADPEDRQEQAELLRAEGVEVLGRIDLARYGWEAEE